MLILMFNMDEYHKYLCLSAGWHCCITDALDEYTNHLENSFIHNYAKYLTFVKSYNNATPIYFCGQKGIRLDRIFQCEIMPESSCINKTLKIGYDFQYLQHRGTPGRYHTEYRLDIVRPGGKRITWIHMGDDTPPYSQNEVQMAPGDVIEFAVCLYNMNGVIDMRGFEWEAPEVLAVN